MQVDKLFTEEEAKALREMAKQDGVFRFVMIRSLVRKEAELRGLMSKDDPVRPPNLAEKEPS